LIGQLYKAVIKIYMAILQTIAITAGICHHTCSNLRELRNFKSHNKIGKKATSRKSKYQLVPP